MSSEQNVLSTTEFDSISAAIGRLHSINPWRREEAVHWLIQVGEPAVEPLLVTLRNERQEARDAAARALNGIGVPAVAPLLQLLKHKNKTMRSAALTGLIGISDDRVFEALNSLITEDYKRQKRRTRYYAGWIVAAMTLVAIMLWVKTLLPKGSGWRNVVDLIRLVVQLSLHLGFIFFASDVLFGQKRNILFELGKTGDKRAIGPLLLALGDGKDEVWTLASGALQALLPTLTAEDRNLLKQEEVEALLRGLNRKDDDLTLAILKALEQIGDDRALSKVEALAISTRANRVCDAAEACLPYLRLRAEEAQQARQLLRASSPVCISSPEELLRPARGSSKTEEQELLRPNLG